MTLDNVVQVRPFNYCVVDEADSILIDEARTPLIISRKGNIKYRLYHINQHILPYIYHTVSDILAIKQISYTHASYIHIIYMFILQHTSTS